MTNPASPSRPSGRDTAGPEGKRVDAPPKKTPSTDMQADDAGTADSGVDEGAQGTAVGSALKQTSKTGNETGSAR
jgi:hypothetical protein